MSEQTIDIAELVGELKKATERLKTAVKETSCARNYETTALNEVNRLQKLLDGAIEAVRNEAPKATIWKENQRRLKGEQQ